MPGRNNQDTTMLTGNYTDFQNTVASQTGYGNPYGSSNDSPTDTLAFGEPPVPSVTGWDPNAPTTGETGFYGTTQQGYGTPQGSGSGTWQTVPQPSAASWSKRSAKRAPVTWKSSPQMATTVITASDQRLETTNRVLIGAVITLIVIAIVSIVVALTFVLTPQEDTSINPVEQMRQNAVNSTPVVAVAEDESSEAAESSEETEYKTTTGSPVIVSQTKGNGLTESEAYSLLLEYYEQADKYDDAVADAAEDFNTNYLKEDKSTRNSLASSASVLKQKIKSDWDDLKEVELPLLSKNVQAYQDICTLYECLWHRIDVIDRAWEISLDYDKPEEHKDKILEPIKADQSGGNNKYYTKFKDLYPKVNLVKP